MQLETYLMKKNPTKIKQTCTGQGRAALLTCKHRFLNNNNNKKKKLLHNLFTFLLVSQIKTTAPRDN